MGVRNNSKHRSIEAERLILPSGIKISLLLAFCVFASAFVFFSKISPVYIYDTDDWRYSTFTRLAIPLWGNWNPTRVFPEFLMPLCGSFAAFVVYPLTGDYVESLMLVDAFVISLFICLYVVSFYALLRCRLHAHPANAACWSLVWYVSHFVLLLTAQENNQYLLYSESVVTFFYYVIPNLVNASFILLDLAGIISRVVDSQGHWLQKGVLTLMVYFGLLSNLYASVILGAYFGGRLLQELAKCIRQGDFNLRTFIKSNGIMLALLACWFIVQLFEANGGRAESLSGGDSYSARLQGCLQHLVSLRHHVCAPAICCIVGFAIIGLICCLRERNDESHAIATEMLRNAISAVLVTVYLVLICSRSYPGHILRSDVFFGIAFFLMLTALPLLIAAVKKLQWLNAATPLFICIALSAAPPNARTFAAPNKSGGTPWTAYAVSSDIVQQMQQADREGANEMTLYVPMHNTGDNWPIAVYGGFYFSDTLSRHRIISHPMQVTVVPTQSKNEEFGMSSPQ